MKQFINQWMALLVCNIVQNLFVIRKEKETVESNYKIIYMKLQLRKLYRYRRKKLGQKNDPIMKYRDMFYSAEVFLEDLAKINDYLQFYLCICGKSQGHKNVCLQIFKEM